MNPEACRADTGFEKNNTMGKEDVSALQASSFYDQHPGLRSPTRSARAITSRAFSPEDQTRPKMMWVMLRALCRFRAHQIISTDFKIQQHYKASPGRRTPKRYRAKITPKDFSALVKVEVSANQHEDTVSRLRNGRNQGFSQSNDGVHARSVDG